MGCLKLSVLEKPYNSDLRVLGKKLNSDFSAFKWLDYGARFYDPTIGRFTTVDKLADDMMQVDKSPYGYAWNNPILLNDPDGNCPWCLGAIAGALVEAGSQVAVGMIKGESFTEAVSNIDIVDVGAAALEGGATAGGSIVRRLAVSAVSNIVQETVDAKISDVAENGVGGINVESDVGKIAKNAAISTLVDAGGEAAEGGIKFIKKTKQSKKIAKYKTEKARKSAAGSKGQAKFQGEAKSIQRDIKANENIAKHVGNNEVVKKMIEDKAKN